MRLDPTASAAGVRLVVHDVIDSTNAEGLRLARAGEAGPLWIVARSQSAGRGRRGRTWISEPGNLHASLLLNAPSPPAHLPELSFVAGLALHDAIGGRVPGLASRLTLKWPNDLLIDRHKCAGILIEAEGTVAIIGIGVNCVHHPADTDFPATDLAAAGLRAASESVFAALSAAMPGRLAQWDRGAGFASVRTDWLARAAGLGRPIRVVLAEGELAGQFDTIDDVGRLVVRLRDGTTRAVAAGDAIMAGRH
jgi:BirA family transcriptional regulator, biotin operon repressor / biotin---[acetyl-CoA-carboxylase] ligase